MRVLITGITGMVGSHLADYVLENHPGVEVHGLVRRRSPMDNIRHILPDLTLHIGDLTDLVSFWRLDLSCYDRIFHLAAQSFVPYSQAAPILTMQTNAMGTLKLFIALVGAAFRGRVHYCSSSEVYGQVQPGDVPISEDCPLRPASPYAVSKVAGDLFAAQYHASFGLDVVRTRAFTHTGARRGPEFAASSFARQIAVIEAGKRDVVTVGNLGSIRTWCDVKDMVRAYWLALDCCKAGTVWNIGGDTEATVGQVLERLKGLAYCGIESKVDERLLRPSDVTLQIPDSSRFRAETGWEPQIPLEETLASLLNYWRDKTNE